MVASTADEGERLQNAFTSRGSCLIRFLFFPTAPSGTGDSEMIEEVA